MCLYSFFGFWVCVKMSQLNVILQEPVWRERERERERDEEDFVFFFREQMDYVDGTRRRQRSLKEWLGLKGNGVGHCLNFRVWVFGGVVGL